MTKRAGTVTHKYYYAGGKLLRETYGSNTLDFCYNAQGYPYALRYNGTVYYYITNLQGDVVHPALHYRNPGLLNRPLFQHIHLRI